MTTTTPARTADISFWFDPVCPFAWITSQWIRKVAAQRDYTVDWRFISLRLINADVDYATHFPAGDEDGHTSGLRLLRVAARTRAEHGPDVIGPLYEAFSSEIFDSPRAAQLTPQVRGSREFAEPLLARAGLPAASPTPSTTPAGTLRSRPKPTMPCPSPAGTSNPDHPVPATRRRRFLRPGHQPCARRPGRRPSLGPRHRAGRVPRLRRTQAQPPRTPPAQQLRRRTRSGRSGGRLARRQRHSAG